MLSDATASSWFHRVLFSSKTASKVSCSTSAEGAEGEMAKMMSGFRPRVISVSMVVVGLSPSTRESVRFSKGSIASILPR